MKSVVVFVVVMLALVGAAVLATVGAIVPPLERSGDSGWLVTAPRADETGDVALPHLFAPARRGVVSLRSGVTLLALPVVSAASGVYTIRLAYREETHARRARS